MRFIVLFVLAWGLAAHSSCAARPLVFAAASLTDVLTSLSTQFEKIEGVESPRFSFAGSSLLARQIIEGAPADLVFSADTEKIDGLEKEGRIVPGTRTKLLSNVLVVVKGRGTTLQIAEPRDLLHVKRLALAEPTSVPAGIYARRWLEAEGLWDELQPRVIPTANVRAALAAVESGNVEAGMVYRTDVAAATDLEIAFEIPAARTEILYEMALLRGGRAAAEARQFWQFLQTPTAAAIFRQHGFRVLR